MANWASNFAIGLTFPVLLAALGASTSFWLYGAVCVLAWMFACYLVPETKGRSVEEIGADLRAVDLTVSKTVVGRDEILSERRAGD